MKLVYFDMRWGPAFKGFAMAPRITYDFEEEESGISLPIYLVGDGKGNFNSGVNIGWQSETDEVVASFFIGKAFAYY